MYKNQQLEINHYKFLDYVEYRRRLGKNFARKAMVEQIPATPMKSINRICPNIEAIELLGQCHLGKSPTKRLCSRCKQHETRYMCEECNIPICLIPCYDLHRIKEGQLESQYKLRILQTNYI